MTPSARLKAAVELVSAMNEDRKSGDWVARSYFRSRRYIGSKDRRDIADRVWRIVRHKARLAWYLDQESPDPRHLVLADSLLYGGTELGPLEVLCSGDNYALERLTDEEISLLSQLSERRDSDLPPHIAAECPNWMWPYFTDLYGDQAATELGALGDEAPVDLRVNTIKADRATARTALEDEGLIVENTPFSPIGLRLSSRTTLGNSKAFTGGLIEVQDEGSQLASLLTDVRSDHDVLDLCAGAGGKTLAMAAAMGGSGRIVAADSEARRLSRAKVRLKRAGVYSVTPRVIDPANTNWLYKRRRSFDRVLVDAPCSGTGAWRRQPDSRWRLKPNDLDRHIAEQTSLITQGGRMVKPGGRLIYVTCSTLRQENEDRAEDFLSRHAHFRALSVGDVWKNVLGTRYAGRGKYLRLSPRRHRTDGFL